MTHAHRRAFFSIGPIATCVLALAVISQGAPTARAQRPSAALEFKDRSAAIDYGAVRVGKHTLDELKVGSSWRMGFNEASVLKTDVPLVAGDAVVAPGAYRVAVHRQEESAFALALAEGARAISGSGDELLKGQFSQAEKPNEKLQVDWTTQAKGKGEKDPVRESTVRVQYGANQLTVPVTLVGARALKAAGWTIDLFTVPADVLKKRMEKGVLTPVANLKSARENKKAPPSFNLLLGKDGASLVPAMEAPTEQFGFGKVSPPDEAWVRKGKVELAENKEPKGFLDGKVEKKGSDLSFSLTFGDQIATIVVAEPTAPAAEPKSGKK